MKCCLLALLFKNASFFDLIINPQATCTVFMRYTHNTQVAHTLTGGTSWPWYSVEKSTTINDILDISVRFPLLFFHGLPDVIDEYLLICGCNGREDDLNYRVDVFVQCSFRNSGLTSSQRSLTVISL